MNEISSYLPRHEIACSDEELDRIVDTRNISYYEARCMLGIEDDNTNHDGAKEVFEIQDEDYGEEYRRFVQLGWTNKAKKEKQRQINKRGAAMACAALREARERRRRK